MYSQAYILMKNKYVSSCYRYITFPGFRDRYITFLGSRDRYLFFRGPEIAISLSLGPEIAISLLLGPEIAISPVLDPGGRYITSPGSIALPQNSMLAAGCDQIKFQNGYAIFTELSNCRGSEKVTMDMNRQ